MIRKVTAKDIEKMKAFAKTQIGIYAVKIIDRFAEANKISTHRAGKTFWTLADDGIFEITWEERNGYARLKRVNE